MNVDDADVLIVGAGIAGASAAYFATRAGRDVTIVDEGVHAASSLPVALVNPLRGHTGRLVARGVDGMAATFALVEALAARGHPVAHGRGLYRPLVDRNARTSSQAYWQSRLGDGAGLAFEWHDASPSSLGLATRVPTLHLPQAGWVEPRSLLDAMARETAATRIAARVVATDRTGATLADGTRIGARTVLWCGGAWGASLLDAAFDGDVPSSEAARFKPGSLVEADVALTERPLSFGLYAVPRDGRTIVGPTREGSTPTFSDTPVEPSAVRHLEDRVAATFGVTIVLRPLWRGVRLAALSRRAAGALSGVDTLTALGSRGFLLGPLLAAEWARSL